MHKNNLKELLSNGLEEVSTVDSNLFHILNEEYNRQKSELMMVASCSLVSPAVLACQAMIPTNVTAEGYPGKRYHAGCGQIDKIEQLAIDRAKVLFNAEYANVQPHSATTANQIVMYSLLQPNDTILGLNLNSGGHLSHGAKVSYSGTYFNAVKYGLKENYEIDYEQVEQLALEHKPKLIICGTTAYPREIDFKRFRIIADKVGAYLLADISHIAGLVISGLHPSPIDYAHITTTCTHKQLFGPRGGLILLGKDSKKIISDSGLALDDHFQKAVFPFFQGAPILNMITAKAMALKLAATPEYKQTMKKIVENAKSLSEYLQKLGFSVISNGTDNHIVLVDLDSKNVTGDIVEKALEQCGIIVNKNGVPRSQRSSNAPSGIRIGTNSLAQRGMGKEEMKICAELIDHVVTHIELDTLGNFTINSTVKDNVQRRVQDLCKEFPINGYN